MRAFHVRLRRAKTILSFWQGGQLVFKNYLTRVTISADPMVSQLLDFFSTWHTPGDLASQMLEYTNESTHAAVRQLLKYTFLVEEGTREAELDDLIASEWAGWLPLAGCFHFGTKDVPYCKSAADIERVLKRLKTESPQPLFSKSYPDVKTLSLPRPTEHQREFFRILTTRRTHRRFSSAKLSCTLVSELLYYTWGITGFLHSRLLGQLPLKTSPSAGARHPIEVYLVSIRVKGLRSGIYHYAAHRHHLEQLRVGKMEDRAALYCADQSWVKNAAALFLMTAMFPRVMWKYRSARAYRTVLLDAGHLCQTFCLTATSLGLAPFCTMAFRDTLIEKDLAVDGIGESVLYVAGVGVPCEDNSFKLRSRFSASL